MSTRPSLIEMDFMVVKEDWSRYLVSDGTQLKIRIVVTKLLRTPEFGSTGYPEIAVDSQHVVSAIVPERLKREPSKERFDIKKEVGEEMKFEPMDEKWQEYQRLRG